MHWPILIDLNDLITSSCHEAFALFKHVVIVRFIDHAFYLPCLVLYVLTHIVSFPIQALTLAIHLLVAR